MQEILLLEDDIALGNGYCNQNIAKATIVERLREAEN